MSANPVQRPESAVFYRLRAEEMLKKADSASSPLTKMEFIALADHWLRLAQTLEAANRP